MSTAFAIDLQNVTKFYRRKVHALRDVSLSVRRGEIFGLLGPNGAGKSTLVKIMMTVIRPTAAAGSILGNPVGHKPTLARVGYLPENHRFPRYLTGRQTIEFFAAICGISRDQRRRRAGELLETVGMSAWGDTKVSQYSKGMMQRIGLATALAADPELVVLDEPTDGVDPVGRRDVRDCLLKLREQGKTVFINSHLLSELELVCDRVADGFAGKLTAALPGVFKEPIGERIQRGALVGGQWCELDQANLHVGISDPVEAQTVLDALRRSGLVIKRMAVMKPTLEELFIEAVGENGGDK
ncbi:MAG: ABC transporter ATP-binding protein [Tepidisphaeraceae bacterium]